MNYFTNPQALWLLLLLPWLAVLALWAGYRKRKALARLGNLLTLQRGATNRPRRKWLRRICLTLCLALLAVAIAGPRWGRDVSPETMGGRDIVVVLDLSRSMRSEHPSRQERAIAALLLLSETVEKRGGHRLALVVFAARPEVMCPLTHDYAHFRFVLKELGERKLFPDVYPRPKEDGDSKGDVSGTRIGAALVEAVRLHDPDSEGAQDILLVSDGDDPARDDEPLPEWQQGTEAARLAHIAVDVVGVGDPDTAWPIPTDSGPLRFDDRPVKTKLEEEPLRDIAAQTRGTYIPLRTKRLPLGKLYHEILANREKQRDNEEGSLLVYRQRYPWFVGAALGLLTLTLLLGDGRKTRVKGRRPRPGSRRVFRWRKGHEGDGSRATTAGRKTIPIREQHRTAVTVHQ